MRPKSSKPPTQMRFSMAGRFRAAGVRRRKSGKRPERTVLLPFCHHPFGDLLPPSPHEPQADAKVLSLGGSSERWLSFTWGRRVSMPWRRASRPRASRE